MGRSVGLGPPGAAPYSLRVDPGTAPLRKRELILAALGAAVLAVAWTWPLAAHLGDRLPYDPRFAAPETAPAHAWLWNFWWVREALERGAPPFRCDWSAWPRGESLAGSTHLFLWGLLSAPLQWIAGPLFALNAMILLLIAAAATAAWALARELGAGRWGASAAAFAWAFHPCFLEAGLDRLDPFATPWPPLFLLVLLRWMQAGERASGGRRLALGAAAGALVGLAILSGWTGALLLLFLGAAAVAFAPRSGPEGAGGRGGLLSPWPWLLGVGACLLLTWPLLLELRRAPSPSPEVAGGPELSDFLTPPGLHPLARPPGLGARARAAAATASPGIQLAAAGPGNRREDSGLYLGIGLLALAASGAIRRPRARRLALMAAALLVLTWDPLGILSSAGADSPVRALLRRPARLLPAATLPLAMAAGLGLDALLRRPGGRPLAVGLALLMAAEFWVAPWPGFRVRVPEAVRAIGASPDSGAVLSLPVLLDAPGEAMAWQSVHGHPILRSCSSRPADPPVAGWPGIAPDLWRLAVGAGGASPDAVSQDLEALGVTHVLADLDRMGEASPLIEALDGMDRWERAETRDGIRWWYRTSLLYPSRE